MKKIKEFVKKNYVLIIPFFTTLFLYLINAIVNKLYPFGSQTYIYSDMLEQYSIYFSYLKEALFSGNNLFGSFSFSLGQNFYGIFTYFCTSPLNILFLFSTKSTIPLFIFILIMLKISLSSLSMSILLKNKLKNNSTIILFSIIYGLMTYNLVYAVNIMWLDLVYLLPLIILGLERMFAGKPLLYLIMLTAAICSNYYIAFSVCIFLIIYFVYYHLVNKSNFKKNVLNFIKYSLLAVLLSSFILIPTMFNMLDGKLETTSADFSLKVKYNPIYLIYRFLIGDYKDLVEDLPFITSSLLVLTFTVTYLFNKNITFKERIYTFCTFALLIVITLLPCTDTIMHCFRIPNLFPYRYAFIISFFLILMASKSFDNYLVNKKNVLLYLIVAFIVYKYLSIYIDFRIIFSSVLVLIYFFIPMFFKNKKLQLIIIFPFVLAELLINIGSTMNGKDSISFKEYAKVYQYEKEINELLPKQDEFYRISVIDKITFNDALSYGYYGVSSFSPTISVNANRLLKDYLGEPLNPSYAVEYLTSTPFSDSFLNIKYKYKNQEKFSVIKNENVFPVMFKITQNDNFKESKIIIENHNNLYKYLSNSSDNIFIREDNFYIEGCELIDNNLISTDINVCTFYLKDKNQKLYLEIDNENMIVPYYNDIDTTSSYGYHIIFDLDKNNRIYLLDSKVKLDHLAAYEMDENKLVKLSEDLNKNKLNITYHNQSKIKGNIINDLDNQIMFSSIPYDDGWHVKINGSKVSTFKNLDSLLAFKLPKGNLEIELYFIPKGFNIGLTVSLLTLALICAIYLKKKFN